MKKALITGISGQDGSYLAEYLLELGYEVHGLIRRNSSYVSHPNIKKIEDKIILHYADLTDSTNIRNIINEVKPDEIYNLAAQSHVAVSFELPEYTADVDALGALRILDTIRSLGLHIRSDTIRHLRLNYLARFAKLHRPKILHSILAVPMVAVSYLRIGLQPTIVKAMASLPVQAYCSIMKVHAEAKTLLPVKLPDTLVAWP